MGKELTKSQYHADFIHDIIKKEYQADALYALAEECQYKAENIRQEGEKYLKGQKDVGCGIKELIKVRESALKNITKYKKDDGTYPIEYVTKYSTKHHKEKVKNSFFSLTRLILIFFVSLIPVLVLTPLVVFFILGQYISESMEMVFILLLWLLGVPLVLTILSNGIYILVKPYRIEEYTSREERKIIKFADYPWKEKLCIENLEKAKKQYEIYQKQYEDTLAVYPRYEEKARIMDNRANHLKKSADRLKSDQQKMFDMNVIPPDYRDLKCLFELYRIFYNNLADTMREAIMIYEDRVFKGIIIKGMCEFNNKLGLISEYIMDVKDELRSIGRDIDFMGGEIHRILENQDDQSEKQDQMIEEMRATRYANEAVQESQERCEWYMHHDFWFK